MAAAVGQLGDGVSDANHKHVLRHHHSDAVHGTKQHYSPHIHVEYQGKNVITIPDGELIEGELPPKKLRLVQAWIDIHEEELMADWSLAVKGEPIFPIDPLR
jgi:hypothetical protein